MIRLLPGGRVARGVMTLTAGTIIAQAITACSTPVVTRLYTPEQIGVISVFLAFFGFWTSLLSWRYESALLIAHGDEESHQVFRLGMLCVVATSLVAWPALHTLSANGILGFELLPAWSGWVAVPILLGYGTYMMLRSWCLRGGLVKDIARASIARSACNASARTILGLLGGGIPALFAAELLGAWGGGGALYRAVRRRFVASTPVASAWRDLRAVMIRYSKFAKYELPSVAINQIAMTIPVPMLAALYGSAAAGSFGMARLLVAIPNAQIGRAVGDTFQMELAGAMREGKYIEARSLFYGLLRSLSLLGLLPLIGIMVLGRWLVPYVFGKSWTEMGVFAVCIAPWMYAALVVSPLSNLLSILQAQQYKLLYDVSTTALMVLIYWMARTDSLNVLSTVLGLSVANVFAYAVYLAILVFVAKRRLGPAST